MLDEEWKTAAAETEAAAHGLKKARICANAACSKTK